MEHIFNIIDEEDWKVSIVFDEENSHIHSCNNEPPQTWSDVYKVYYAWKVVIECYGEKMVLFDMPYDEDSELVNLSEVTREVIKKGKEQHIRPIGQPSSEWNIKKTGHIYEFMVFDNFYDNGYRFYLNEGGTANFCKWLDEINEIALKNGEGI